MILYRKLDANGDYVFGQNAQDFLTGPAAVGQAIQTALQLYQGQFWRNLNAGIPMYQQILGTSGVASNIAAVDQIFINAIKAVPGVQGIVSYKTTWDSVGRHYTGTFTVQTIYSQTIAVTI